MTRTLRDSKSATFTLGTGVEFLFAGRYKVYIDAEVADAKTLNGTVAASTVEESIEPLTSHQLNQVVPCCHVYYNIDRDAFCLHSSRLLF